VYLDGDGDIIFSTQMDYWEIGSSSRFRDLFEFTVKHVNEEWL
jgi:hypothetical protein